MDTKALFWWSTTIRTSCNVADHPGKQRYECDGFQRKRSPGSAFAVQARSHAVDVMMASDTEGFDLAFKLKEDPESKAFPSSC